MISCYGCKYGDLDTITEPCKSCLEKNTPPHWRFEPIGQDGKAEESRPQMPEPKQLTLFDIIQEETKS